MSEPWQPTTGRWRNKPIRGMRLSDGTYAEEWTKAIAGLLGGHFSDYDYGTDTPVGNSADEQVALICAPQTFTVALDVDDPAAYATAGIPFGPEHAHSTRGDHFHVLLDYSGIPAELWPTQGEMPGGHVKSNGFVPEPGSEHYTGALYEPTANKVPHRVTEEQARIIKAVRTNYRPLRRGRPGRDASGGSYGRDGDLAARVYGWVFSGLQKEQCYQRWVPEKALIGEDPARPWLYEDFDRHWRGAHAKYMAHLEKQEADARHAAAGMAGAGAPSRDGVSGFWDARPELAYVRALARARRCSPDAVLVMTLVRVMMSIPPSVVLPPLIGGPASLNLFTGITGPSGTGKGSTLKVAREIVPDLPDGLGFWTVGLGSGEGLQHQFMRYDKDTKQYIRIRSAVLFTAEEAETVAALKTRTASTLLPELRKAAMGEDLGFAYVDKEKALRLLPHTYRFGVMLGIQPSSAGWLLDDHGTGTPQRFLFASALDAKAPDVAPPEPPPWQWHWEGLLPAGKHGDLRVLPVCDAVRRDVNASYLARSRGEETDLLAGHALLMREKAAAALAFFAYPQRAEISDEDWQLAGEVMHMSARALGELRGAMASEAMELIRRSGTAEGAKRDVASEARHQHAVERIARNLLGKLESGGEAGLTRKEMRGKLAHRDREYLDDAISKLASDGLLTDDKGRFRRKI
jgi:hypothetical protein